MRALSSLFAVLVLVFLMAGCGQKGPLYRPAPEAAPVMDADQAASDQQDTGTR